MLQPCRSKSAIGPASVLASRCKRAGDNLSALPESKPQTAILITASNVDTRHRRLGCCPIHAVSGDLDLALGGSFFVLRKFEARAMLLGAAGTQPRTAPRKFDRAASSSK